MVSFFHLLPPRHGIALAAVICAVLLLAVLAFSGVDLAPLLTLRTVTESGNTVTETRYNPIAFLGLGALAAAVCGVALLLAQIVSPLIRRGPHATAEQVASASKTLGRELAGVLTIIRRNIANN